MEPRRQALRDELLGVITDAIAAHPRSQQKLIGPSELGTPCRRKLGYKLAKVEPLNERLGWKPTVGTAVHAWLEEKFGGQPERYLTERRVTIGKLGDEELTGTCDLYVLASGTVADFKILGASGLSIKREDDDPGQTYRTQAHLYGMGYVNAGYPVREVAVLALPASGELDEAWLWAEPYKPKIAQWALDRANIVLGQLQERGLGLLEQLPTANDFCGFCPFLDEISGCPGHRAVRAQACA